MKKTVVTCVLSMMVLCWIPSLTDAATYIPVKEMSSPATYCNPSESNDYYVYIDLLDEITYTHPRDNFWVDGSDALIWGGGNGSSIDLWRNNGVLTKCNTWERVSNVVKDWEDALAFLNTDDCVFNIPNYTKTSDPNAIDAQIHFTIWYREIGVWNRYSSSLPNTILYYWPKNGSQYKCYPNWNSISDANNCSNVSVNYDPNPSQTHVWECQNYRIFRCWDGLVNKPIGNAYSYDNEDYVYEECDPEAPEWKNRTDWKTCNTSCKIEYATSTCGNLNWNTAYNKNYSSPRITESSSWLCGVGKLVAWSLSYNKDTWKYTWDCKNGDAASVSCNAQDLWCGDGTVQSTYEECDPEDKTQSGWWTWTWKKCNSSCKLENIPRTGPVCSSSYNNTTKYTETSAAWLSSADSLCDKWSLVPWSFDYNDNGTPRTFTWSCTNDWYNTGCVAYQQWCGDGVKNGNEVCDPEDKTNKVWWGDWCSASCDKATYNPWICGSKYHQQKTYMPISVDWITEYTPWLCDKWTVIHFDKHTSSHVYTWQCTNGWNPSGECRADQEWCGDGTVQSAYEECDAWNKNGTSSSSCSSTCTKVADVSCGAKDKWTRYFSWQQTSPWLSKDEEWMCADGLTVWKPYITWTDNHLEWTCSNANGWQKTCAAYQAYCGDGVLQSSKEECDYNDESETNWWNDGCDTSCKQKNEIVSACDVKNTFNFTLRSGYEYTFWDEFNATDADRRLFGDPDVTFLEQQDFNRWPNPTFKWTNRNSEKKVAKNTTERIIESTPKYYIQDHPDKRSEDNIYIEYNVKYGNSSTSPESRWKTHKECVFYEISRCGDGIIDTDWVWKESNHKAEECDPGSEWTKVLPDWRVCNENCEIVTVNPPLCNSDWHGQRVTNLENGSYLCREGNVSGFNYDETAHKWTWTCSNVVWYENCRAIEPYCGDGIWDEGEQCDPKDPNHTNWENGICNNSCQVEYPKWTAVIEKTLINPIEVDHTWQVLQWEIVVTASWWDISDFEIHDKMPNVLTYSGWSLGDNPDWLNVTYRAKNNPQKSWNYNIYYWDAAWTLKSWHSMTMKVVTEVKKMPTSKDDYKNIACVIKDNEELSCDDDQPPVKKWTAVIEKTLINPIEVDHTWQVLQWEIVVTASWWDISDFEIHDKMPNVLTYSGWSLGDNPDWLNVTYRAKNNPQKSWNYNIYYWDAAWTLKSWHSMTMKVVTEVKKMPTSKDDYKNIACVIKDNEELSCDDDQPPVKNWELDVEKFLVSQDKYVTHTWQELEWKIIVKAKNWDVKMQRIKDKIPTEFVAYSGYYTGHVPSGITIYEPTWTNWKEITWNTTGTLKSWDYIELYVITYVIKMPKDDTIENVACANPVDPGKEDCGTWHISDLRIKKYVSLDNKDWKKSVTGKVWDTIIYRIDFGNNGDDAILVTLNDYLPKWVEFKSGTLTVWKEKSTWEFITWWVDEIRYEWELKKLEWVDINSYTTILLGKGEGWTLRIEWTIKDDKDNTTNFACIFDEKNKEDSMECDNAHHNIEDKEIKCNKLDVQTWELPNGGWEKEVKCTASEKVDLITIDCWEWAKWNRYITWSNTSEVSGKCSYPSWAKTYSVKCEVKNGENTYTSDGCQWSVTVKGWWSSCFPAWTQVAMADGSTKNIEDVEVGDEVLSYNTDTNINEANVVVKKFVHENNVHEMYELTINWKVLKVTDVHPFYVKNSASSKGYDWVEAQYLKVGDVLMMIDGSLVAIEKVNHYANQETVYNLEVEGNHDYFVDKWYLVHNKWWCKTNCDPTPSCKDHPDDAVCQFANPQCFNVNNWNVSIELWEYLPVYINVYKDAGESPDYNYIVYKPKDYPLWEDNINDMLDKECTDGNVALNSIKCRYIIRNSSGVVYSDVRPCLDGGKSVDANDLIRAWAGWQGANYGVDMQTYDEDGTPYTYSPQVYMVDTNSADIRAKVGDRLWEYQYQIEIVEYAQCMDGKRVRNNGVAGPVCQNNFVLTEPYTVQKTPSWNLTASINKLFKFKEANGTTPFSSYLVNAITTSDYKPNTKVNDAMNDFIKKYEKLAVKVTEELKKVPGKDIYFVSWNMDPSKITTLNKPITIVQMTWNTIISWNVNYNIMVLTRWNIIFNGDCTKNQTVKWIFYASWNLIRWNVNKNNNTSNRQWCDKWWLHVKWVLIWNNFDNLMNRSRSHIENWFKAGTPDKKKKEIMDGASVLIEYSPSIFTKSTMPPGAEDFTTALSIYKQ